MAKDIACTECGRVFPSSQMIEINLACDVLILCEECADKDDKELECLKE